MTTDLCCVANCEYNHKGLQQGNTYEGRDLSGEPLAEEGFKD